MSPPASAIGPVTSSRPEVEVTPHGTIAVRDDPGFGYQIDHDFLKHITSREENDFGKDTISGKAAVT